MGKKQTETREELVQHIQRLQAEFDNYRKRTTAELQDARTRAADATLKALLPIVDNLALAIAHTKEQQNVEELLKGILLVQDQLQAVLAEEGISPISTEGKFNPELHEAMMTTPSDQPPGTIVQVIQPGYTRNGRVLRPAKVSVAR